MVDFANPDLFASSFDTSRQTYTEGEYRQIFENVCLGLNRLLLSNKAVNSYYSGSTGNIVLLHQHVAVCANVGDSRAGIIMEEGGEWSVDMLCTDQTPADPSEKERVLKAGGRVHPCFGRLH